MKVKKKNTAGTTSDHDEEYLIEDLGPVFTSMFKAKGRGVPQAQDEVWDCGGVWRTPRGFEQGIEVGV
jgi:hypothetical protein